MGLNKFYIYSFSKLLTECFFLFKHVVSPFYGMPSIDKPFLREICMGKGLAHVFRGCNPRKSPRYYYLINYSGIYGKCSNTLLFCLHMDFLDAQT